MSASNDKQNEVDWAKAMLDLMNASDDKQKEIDWANDVIELYIDLSNALHDARARAYDEIGNTHVSMSLTRMSGSLLEEANFLSEVYDSKEYDKYYGN